MFSLEENRVNHSYSSCDNNSIQFFSLPYLNDDIRPSMSRGAGLGLDRNHERDFVLSSVEEFVKRFDGTRPINKVFNRNNDIVIRQFHFVVCNFWPTVAIDAKRQRNIYEKH